MNKSQHNYLAESLDHQMKRAQSADDLILLAIRRDAHRVAVCGHLVDDARTGAPKHEITARPRYGEAA